jgi:hypothetical protein
VALVSDGSGQNEAERNPSNGVLGVPLRANAVLQSRIREAQAHELRARKRSLLLRGLMFVHLKEDLEVDPVDWVDCPDPYDASTDARPASRRGPLTAYGLDKEVQSLLAAVRTDLDSFADVEADALMTSGYRMTEYQFKHSADLAGVPVGGNPEPWAFLGVERGMTSGGKSQARLKQFLAVSKYTAFKPWRLSIPLKVTAIVLALGAIAGIGWVWTTYPNQLVIPQMTLGQLLRNAAWTAIVVFATLRLGRFVGSALRWRESLYRVGTGIGMSVFGWLVARIHLMFFDPLFLRLGSASRFKEQADREAPVA